MKVLDIILVGMVGLVLAAIVLGYNNQDPPRPIKYHQFDHVCIDNKTNGVATEDASTGSKWVRIYIPKVKDKHLIEFSRVTPGKCIEG